MKQKRTRARRLTRKEEFDRVFTYGQKISHRSLSAWLAPASQPRLGCAISKKYGNSVQRNQFKRRVRAAFRQLYDQLPTADMVVTAAPRQEPVAYRDIEAFFHYLGTHDPAGRQKSAG